MKNLLLFLLLFFGMNVVYGLEFDQFDPNDINSLREATRYYQQEYDKKRGTIEAEEDFDKFWQYYIKFDNRQNQKIYLPYETIDNSIQKQIDKYSEQYYKYGLVAQFDEGEFMLVPSRRYLYENFAPYLSKPHQELLKFEISDVRTIYDGRYIISISELKNQIKFYEGLIKKYPEFSKRRRVYDKVRSIEEDIKHYPNIYY